MSNSKPQWPDQEVESSKKYMFDLTGDIQKFQEKLKETVTAYVQSVSEANGVVDDKDLYIKPLENAASQIKELESKLSANKNSELKDSSPRINMNKDNGDEAVKNAGCKLAEAWIYQAEALSGITSILWESNLRLFREKQLEEEIESASLSPNLDDEILNNLNRVYNELHESIDSLSNSLGGVMEKLPLGKRFKSHFDSMTRLNTDLKSNINKTKECFERKEVTISDLIKAIDRLEDQKVKDFLKGRKDGTELEKVLNFLKNMRKESKSPALIVLKLVEQLFTKMEKGDRKEKLKNISDNLIKKVDINGKGLADGREILALAMIATNEEMGNDGKLMPHLLKDLFNGQSVEIIDIYDTSRFDDSCFTTLMVDSDGSSGIFSNGLRINRRVVQKAVRHCHRNREFISEIAVWYNLPALNATNEPHIYSFFNSLLETFPDSPEHVIQKTLEDLRSKFLKDCQSDCTLLNGILKEAQDSPPGSIARKWWKVLSSEWLESQQIYPPINKETLEVLNQDGKNYLNYQRWVDRSENHQLGSIIIPHKNLKYALDIRKAYVIISLGRINENEQIKGTYILRKYILSKGENSNEFDECIKPFIVDLPILIGSPDLNLKSYSVCKGLLDTLLNGAWKNLENREKIFQKGLLPWAETFGIQIVPNKWSFTKPLYLTEWKDSIDQNDYEIEWPLNFEMAKDNTGELSLVQFGLKSNHCDPIKSKIRVSAGLATKGFDDLLKRLECLLRDPESNPNLKNNIRELIDSLQTWPKMKAENRLFREAVYFHTQYYRIPTDIIKSQKGLKKELDQLIKVCIENVEDLCYYFPDSANEPDVELVRNSTSGSTERIETVMPGIKSTSRGILCRAIVRYK